jgi:hypothetical protein
MSKVTIVNTTGHANLVAAAMRGDATSQYCLGEAYRLGEGAPHSPALAERWLRRAGEQGHAYAQHRLSVLYLHGAKSHAPAAVWVRQALVQDGQAANVALLYPEGIDVAPDPQEAFAWATAAAEQRLACAEASLGMFYLRGIACEQDVAEAQRWFARAAAQGDTGGALGLGILYEYGLGVIADPAEAARWYATGAERGNPAAEVGLARVKGALPAQPFAVPLAKERSKTRQASPVAAE